MRKMIIVLIIAALLAPITATGAFAQSGGTAGLSGKTAAAFKMLDGKNYHMKAKTTVGGKDVITETFVKGSMIASVAEMGGATYRSVHRDNKVYVINDKDRTVMVFSATKDNTPGEPVQTSGFVMTGSGTAQFNGKNLPYEEYSLASGKAKDVKTQFFLNGNTLAGIRAITGKNTIDMVILALDQKVPGNVFDIPSGYKRTEM